MDFREGTPRPGTMACAFSAPKGFLGRPVFTLPRVELAGDEPPSLSDLAAADADREGLSSEEAPGQKELVGEPTIAGEVIRRGRLAEVGDICDEDDEGSAGVAITVAGIASPSGLDPWSAAVAKLEISRLFPHFRQKLASAM